MNQTVPMKYFGRELVDYELHEKFKLRKNNFYKEMLLINSIFCERKVRKRALRVHSSHVSNSSLIPSSFSENTTKMQVDLFSTEAKLEGKKTGVN